MAIKTRTHLQYALDSQYRMQIGSQRYVEGPHTLEGPQTVELSNGKIFEVEPAGTHAVYVTRVE